ncbi:NfeD family protein [Hyphomonas sp. WL0036]|uniref:NfeD family protein n=1 Tax=Hyphomonas sediminis TaxID=2866160 RepID=UPI001C82700D|nr:NfeD family protein [Hyphomonas sediminis]MBY9067044.1 NfeD family protein [Hyphomonas sediminis]
MDALLSSITWWHWLAFALILFGVEMITGTFDLLMASIGAVITAAFAAFAPESIGGWNAQVIVFGVLAVLLIVGSRMVFPGMRKAAPEHPTLNKRMAQLIGQHGLATKDFTGGSGQVKIGDTVWGAEAADGSEPILAGDAITVEASVQNTVIVRRKAA